MDKNVMLSFLLICALFGCIKEDYPPECVPRELSEIQKSNFGGKWIWNKTVIEEWFDVGPSNFFEITPQSEGFEYYFVLTDEGMFRGYRNDTLIHELILNKSTVSSIDDQKLASVNFNIDCTNLELILSRFPQVYHLDTLFTFSYPISFYDGENQLRSRANTFVRE